MTSKNPYPHLEAYDAFSKLIELFDEVEIKGKKTPYTSINGYMTCFLKKEGSMAMRLSDEDIAIFLQNHKTQLTQQHGKTMKAFVDIPNELQYDIQKLSTFYKLSLRHAKSLKPK